MRNIGLIAASALLGIAPGAEAKPARPGHAPERITYARLSWGAVLERWTVEGTLVEYEAPKSPAYNGGAVEVNVKRFALTPAQRRLLNARVAAAAKTIGLPDECSNYIPDGPYGSLSWKVRGMEKKLNFTASCMEGPNALKSKAGFAVGYLVSDIAKSKPVTETKKVD